MNRRLDPGRQAGIARLSLRSLIRRKAIEHDLDRELDFHLEEQTTENIGRGMSPREARAAALRALGGVAQIQEECRDMRRTNHVENLLADLKYALRTLRAAPGFTTVILLTLALSIGATSAIFSVIEGVLLRPLPFAQPESIVRIFFNSDVYPKFPLNPFDFQDFRARNRTLSSVAAITRNDLQLSGAGEPVMLHSFRVTAGYFALLGFKPARGREFTTQDENSGSSRTVVLSDRLWRSRFSADPNIIGRIIRLDAIPFTVVGVMPPGVQHPGNDYHSLADGETVDLWYPFIFTGDRNNRGAHFVEGIGRLRSGVTAAQANADLSGILRQLANEHQGDKNWRVYLVPLYQELVGRTRRMLFVLLGAVGLLLLIACVNAANLLLARATSRQREIAVRASLGAARGRLVRQLLTESLLIAFAGAALGTALAVAGVRTLVSLLPPGFPRASAIHLDPTVFAFTLLIAVFTGFLFGIAPALTASAIDLQQSLRESGRGTMGGRGAARLRDLLVVCETGLACVLLIGAGLMLHSFVNLLRSDPGFRPDRALTASVSLTEDYKKIPDVVRFYQRLTAGLEAVPGVQSAGVGTDLPFTGYDENFGGFILEGQPTSISDKTTARYHVASRGYFKALGMPLLGGRFFTSQDTADAMPVMIINETMARRYWPNGDAVGKRLSFDNHPKTDKDWFRIVGIVRDVKDQPGEAGAHPAFWWPLEQMPVTFTNMSVVVRTATASQLRAAVRNVDSSIAVADVKPLEEITGESVSTQRFALFLIGLFAALALLLAAIGMYGVISYSVGRRMPEFGMRMALGAKPSDVLRMILGQGIKLSVVGAVIGIVCGAIFARLLGNLLYEVGAVDPVTLASVGPLAVLTAVLACYLPARRATSADPMKALRSE